jgi:hypothetical protein
LNTLFLLEVQVAVVVAAVEAAAQVAIEPARLLAYLLESHTR